MKYFFKSSPDRGQCLKHVSQVPSWSPWIPPGTMTTCKLLKFDRTSVRGKKMMIATSYWCSTLGARRSLHGTTTLRKEG